MGKELAVAMETDFGWIRHGPISNLWGECHPPPGFTVDGWRAPLEPAIPAVLMGSVCILLGTSPSGNMHDSSCRYLRGLERRPQPEKPLSWLLPP